MSSNTPSDDSDDEFSDVPDHDQIDISGIFDALHTLSLKSHTEQRENTVYPNDDAERYSGWAGTVSFPKYEAGPRDPSRRKRGRAREGSRTALTDFSWQKVAHSSSGCPFNMLLNQDISAVKIGVDPDEHIYIPNNGVYRAAKGLKLADPYRGPGHSPFNRGVGHLTWEQRALQRDIKRDLRLLQVQRDPHDSIVHLASAEDQRALAIHLSRRLNEYEAMQAAATSGDKMPIVPIEENLEANTGAENASSCLSSQVGQNSHLSSHVVDSRTDSPVDLPPIIPPPIIFQRRDDLPSRSAEKVNGKSGPRGEQETRFNHWRSKGDLSGTASKRSGEHASREPSDIPVPAALTEKTFSIKPIGRRSESADKLPTRSKDLAVDENAFPPKSAFTPRSRSSFSEDAMANIAQIGASPYTDWKPSTPRRMLQAVDKDKWFTGLQIQTESTLTPAFNNSGNHKTGYKDADAQSNHLEIHPATCVPLRPSIASSQLPSSHLDPHLDSNAYMKVDKPPIAPDSYVTGRRNRGSGKRGPSAKDEVGRVINNRLPSNSIIHGRKAVKQLEPSGLDYVLPQLTGKRVNMRVGTQRIL